MATKIIKNISWFERLTVDEQNEWVLKFTQEPDADEVELWDKNQFDQFFTWLLEQ